MIKRYSNDRIAEIWSLENKYKLWQRIEELYVNNILHKELNGFVTANQVLPEEVRSIELETKHELVAFLGALHNSFLHTYEEEPPAKILNHLHYGLTSSDVIDTAFSLQIRESISHLIFIMLELKTSLTDKIRELGSIPSAGRTHGKHAEEINFTSRLELFNSELLFCLERLTNSVKSLYGKMKGPVGNGTYVYNQAALKTLEALNLKEAPATTQVIPRIYYMDTMYALVMLASVYERFATFIRLSAIDEIDEIQEHFSAFQTGSSCMPHKNNPIVSENICGLARYIKSNFQVALDNNNLWWERDISHSSNERLIWPESFHLICNLTLKLNKLIQTMQINFENIESNLKNASLNSHRELLEGCQDSDRFFAYEKVRQNYFFKKS